MLQFPAPHRHICIGLNYRNAVTGFHAVDLLRARTTTAKPRPDNSPDLQWNILRRAMAVEAGMRLVFAAD